MLIRCEKCSLMYELDEGLLPPQGAPVQCSKCGFVFTAFPPPPGAPRDAASPSEPGPPAAPAMAPPVDAQDDDDRSEILSTSQLPVEPEGGPGEEVSPGGVSLGPPAPGSAAVGSPPPKAVPIPRRAPVAPAPSPGAPASGAHPAAAPHEPPVDRAAAAGTVKEPKPAGAPGAHGPEAPRLAGARDEPRFTPDGRPIRKVPFPTEDPPPPGPQVPPLRPPRGGVKVGAHASPWGRVVLLILLAIVALLLYRFWRAKNEQGAPVPVGALERGLGEEGQPLVRGLTSGARLSGGGGSRTALPWNDFAHRGEGHC